MRKQLPLILWRVRTKVLGPNIENDCLINRSLSIVTIGSQRNRGSHPSESKGSLWLRRNSACCLGRKVDVQGRCSCEVFRGFHVSWCSTFVLPHTTRLSFRVASKPRDRTLRPFLERVAQEYRFLFLAAAANGRTTKQSLVTHPHTYSLSQRSKAPKQTHKTPKKNPPKPQEKNKETERQVHSQTGSFPRFIPTPPENRFIHKAPKKRRDEKKHYHNKRRTSSPSRAHSAKKTPRLRVSLCEPSGQSQCGTQSAQGYNGAAVRLA